ncbi:uncharacterized protein PHACADRAFT_86126, partial [Phanerochaete carnosa HHB-10118-sp]
LQLATNALEEAFQYRILNNDKEPIAACLWVYVAAGLLEGDICSAETANGTPVETSVRSWGGRCASFAFHTNLCSPHTVSASTRLDGANYRINFRLINRPGSELLNKLPPYLRAWWDEVSTVRYSVVHRFTPPLCLIGVHPDHQCRGLATQPISLAHSKCRAVTSFSRQLLKRRRC